MSETFVFKVKMAIGSLALLSMIIAIIVCATSFSTKNAEEQLLIFHPIISGVSGCKGEAVVEPKFKRGDIM